MIRSDYRLRGTAACTTFPVRSRSSPRFRSSDAPPSWKRFARCCRRPRARAGAWCCWPASRAPARAASCASSRARRRSDGALVLYGACDAVVHTPYGPFVEALDHLARVTDPAELRAALGTAGGELTRLLPDLPARIGDLPPPVKADPDTERHRLHTAVTDLLAGHQPAPARTARDRGRALGRRPDAASPSSPRARGRERAPAAARHVPRHRGRPAGHALRNARRPAPIRRRRAAAAGRAFRAKKSRSSSAAPPEAGRRRRARARAGDRRPHRRQRVPRLRAVARARRDRASSRSPAARSG